MVELLKAGMYFCPKWSLRLFFLLRVIGKTCCTRSLIVTLFQNWLILIYCSLCISCSLSYVGDWQMQSLTCHQYFPSYKPYFLVHAPCSDLHDSIIVSLSFVQFPRSIFLSVVSGLTSGLCVVQLFVLHSAQLPTHTILMRHSGNGKLHLCRGH